MLPNNSCMQKNTAASACRQIAAVFLILIFDSEFFEGAAAPPCKHRSLFIKEGEISYLSVQNSKRRPALAFHLRSKSPPKSLEKSA